MNHREGKTNIRDLLKTTILPNQNLQVDKARIQDLLRTTILPNQNLQVDKARIQDLLRTTILPNHNLLVDKANIRELHRTMSLPNRNHLEGKTRKKNLLRTRILPNHNLLVVKAKNKILLRTTIYLNLKKLNKTKAWIKVAQINKLNHNNQFRSKIHKITVHHSMINNIFQMKDSHIIQCNNLVNKNLLNPIALLFSKRCCNVSPPKQI